MHPASRILTYLLAALVIPGLPFFLVPFLLLAALVGLRGRQPWRLAWRTRWLLLVLLLGYAWSLPGEAALPWLGEVSPTWEGLARGSAQALHLLLLLLWLDWLVLRLPSEAMMGGVYFLLRPLRLLAWDPERATLRLGLTLRAIESLERGRGNLKRLFSDDLGRDLPSSFALTMTALRPLDYLPPLVLTSVLLWLNA